MADVARGYAGSQGVQRDGEGGIDFLEVVGSSRHGGGSHRDVGGDSRAIFHLRTGYVYVGQ